MADNVGYTPGTGATVAADEIDGVLYQRVKIAVGPDGVASDASADNPLPVAIAGPNPLTVEVNNVRDILIPVVGLLDSPRGYDKSLQRQRGTVILESGTLTSLTNIISIDSIQGRIGQLGENLSAWAACVRSRIS
jgi:hypothetical protein